MSPLPNRSSQSPKPSAPQESSPDSQVDASLDPALETNEDHSSEPTPDAVPSDDTSDEPKLVLKRPVMRPAPTPEPSEASAAKGEAQTVKVEKSHKSSGQTASPLEIVPGTDKSSTASSSSTEEAGSAAPESSPLPDQAVVMRQHPIPPPSEPMQYRAIGLIRGRYTPSEEQFTRGEMLTTDGVAIEAVLLGRVMSLVKNHLDLTQDHLWVVYPRTREREEELHAQIVGVWEPEKLSKPLTDEADESASTDPTSDDDEVDALEADAALAESETDVEDDAEETENDIDAELAEDIDRSSEEPILPHLEISSADIEDNYFSIRGEVIFQTQEPDEVVVKIQQSPRKQPQKAKVFKLKLRGALGGKAVGYFWDLHVQRDNRGLVIREATSIGMVPPKKRKKGVGVGGKRPFKPGSRPGGPPRKNFDSRPSGGGVSRPAEPTSSSSRRPVPKPVKRREQSDQGGAS